MRAKILTLFVILAILISFSGHTAADLPPNPRDDPEIPHTLSAFSDVDAGAWYAPSAAFLYLHGVFRGTSSTTFAPDSPMTRAMLAEVLYRYMGSPELPDPHAFPDIGPGAWYADAAAWVWECGLLNDGETFGPDEPVTLTECITVLCRCVGTLGTAAPLIWAEDCGLLDGLPDEPDAVLTRGEAAVLLTRFSQTFIAPP